MGLLDELRTELRKRKEQVAERVADEAAKLAKKQAKAAGHLLVLKSKDAARAAAATAKRHINDALFGAEPDEAAVTGSDSGTTASRPSVARARDEIGAHARAHERQQLQAALAETRQARAVEQAAECSTLRDDAAEARAKTLRDDAEIDEELAALRQKIASRDTP